MKLRTVFVLALISVASLAIAGNAHFVGTPTITTNGDTAFVSGKVAGLGNVPQIHVEFSGDAACVNRGSNKPQAGNKQSFSVGGDFPVQNGKALFTLALEATFSPECVPPMSVEWSNLSVVVTAADGTSLIYP
jgi:hypothetical protein